MPIVRGTGRDLSSGAYTLALEFDESNNPVFIGATIQGTDKAAPGWLIRKLSFDISNNLIDVHYANGSQTFDQIWSNRHSLPYV